MARPKRIEPARIAAPDTGAETVERVVGDRERLVVVLEGGDRDDRSENLLLEDAHLVVALEHRGLDIEATGKVTRQVVAYPARQDLRALLAADIDIGQDLLHLLGGRLRADHGGRIQRIALDDRLNPLQGPLHEAVKYLFVDQGAARTGADLALVEREHDEALDRLFEKIVALVH